MLSNFESHPPPYHEDPKTEKNTAALFIVYHCTSYTPLPPWLIHRSGTQSFNYIYILDAVPPVHVVSNHIDIDKRTTANGGTFTSSSASLSSQLR